MVLKSGVWYVVAARDGEVRTYRASRIESAELSEERFERPANFDLADYWTESTAAYERDAPRLAVLVRVAPDRVELLENLVGGSAMRAAERLEVPDDLAAALATNADAKRFFEAFPPSSKKIILTWIASAKRPVSPRLASMRGRPASSHDPICSPRSRRSRTRRCRRRSGATSTCGARTAASTARTSTARPLTR